MVTVIGPKDPARPNAINCTSRSTNWSRDLSPFFLGPIVLYGNYTAQNMENAWQYSKVYKRHIDEQGNPAKEYFDWAQEGWNKTRADRYPMGKGVKPEYSYWDGKKMSYVEARKAIYIPLYSEAVRKTLAFRFLANLYKENADIVLWDFDGYDHRALNLTWEDVVNSDTKKCGHGFVLAMMLEGAI